MKHFFILCFALTGCYNFQELPESEELEQDTVQDFAEDFSSSLPKELGCPVDYKEVVINNKVVLIAIPTDCGIDPIDQGRPVEQEFFEELEIVEQVENY